MDGSDYAPLRIVAREVLDNFDSIAAAAIAGLGERGRSLGDLAVINQATAENIARDMHDHNVERINNLERLIREPAIARLVVVDEDDRQETIYISSGGTVDRGRVRLCSYLSPKGALAELPVGEGGEISLPDGRHYYEVLEKITFQPSFHTNGWDAVPAVRHAARAAPLTIRSLRDFLLGAGIDREEVDAVTAWLAGDRGESDDNLIEGLRRETLTAMELRVAPILDKFQGMIFRLPLNSEIAILGPPGTGKTTTLVKRLRQKIDTAILLSTGENQLVAGPETAQLDHRDSWILFSPTELLRLYVAEALGTEGVPVSDARLWTWDTYRRTIGRELRILRQGATGGGLVLRDGNAALLPATLADQIAWAEAFDAWQRKAFLEQLAAEAGRLSTAVDERAALLGAQINATLARQAGRLLTLLGDLAELSPRLRGIADAGRDESRNMLRDPLFAYARDDGEFLPALTRFVESLSSEENEDSDEDDIDADEEDSIDRARVLRGNHLAEDVFIRAMRARAIAQASGRSPNAQSRAGRLLAWLRERGLRLPELRDAGAALLVQRAALRLSRAASDYLSRIPLRYRGFRRAMRERGDWYIAAALRAGDAGGAEVDLILMAMLRTARAIEDDRLLIGRLGGRAPAALADISRLRRNQVLVDEATDFSPVQLACMRALANPRTDSFFMSGDFNQRLTRWGSKSREELRWVSPGLDIRTVSVGYRQSRRLAEFARALGELQGKQVEEIAPDYFDNVGVDPVIGLSLGDLGAKVAWLNRRIREIDRFTGVPLPTVAILVCDGSVMDEMAAALSVALEDMNIRAVACPKGQVRGNKGDVRIFEIEHIKGLEFEAVFLTDIDHLEQREAEMFDQYVYVGATRAATFLGLTCQSATLPAVLAPLRTRLAAQW